MVGLTVSAGVAPVLVLTFLFLKQAEGFVVVVLVFFKQRLEDWALIILLGDFDVH